MKRFLLLLFLLCPVLGLGGTVTSGNLYVDTVLGTDDLSHGESSGAGACKSLKYCVETKLSGALTGPLNIYCSGSTADAITAAGTIYIGGHSTTAVNYIKIQAAVGQEALKTGISTSRYRLYHDDSVKDGTSIDVEDAYVHFAGLQIVTIDGGVSAYRQAISLRTNTVSSLIDSCYIQVTGTSGGHTRAISVNKAGATVNIVNSILVSDGNGYQGLLANAGTVNVYNSIAYRWREYGYYVGASGTVNAVNSVAFLTTTVKQDFAGSGTLNVSYCASDDNIGTNNIAESGGGASWPSDFSDASTGNFTLLVGSGLKDVGLSDPGSGLFSDDMDGVVRGTLWDVGVHEYQPKGNRLGMHPR